MPPPPPVSKRRRLDSETLYFIMSTGPVDTTLPKWDALVHHLFAARPPVAPLDPCFSSSTSYGLAIASNLGPSPRPSPASPPPCRRLRLCAQMDGTLLNSSPAVNKAWNLFAQTYTLDLEDILRCESLCWGATRAQGRDGGGEAVEKRRVARMARLFGGPFVALHKLSPGCSLHGGLCDADPAVHDLRKQSLLTPVAV